MTTMQQLAPSQASAEVPINENFETISWAGMYGKRHLPSPGLTWGYYGGVWGGVTVADNTLTLTNAATNYIVVLRATGAISVATTTANWNNSALYGRVYRIVTASGQVTSVEDHRCGPFGIFAEQRAVFVALTYSATINLDCLYAQRVKSAELTMTGNATLANPTNMVDGLQIVIPIKQDATGSRLLTYGIKWKFPGGAPALSTAANARDVLSGVYDLGTDTILGRLDKAFA